VGGYDEALSGNYGTDFDFRRRVAHAGEVKTLSYDLVRYEHVGDSSTKGYDRRWSNGIIKKIIAARGKSWRPRVLSFPYVEVVTTGAVMPLP
jgi:hypothetical protein